MLTYIIIIIIIIIIVNSIVLVTSLQKALNINLLIIIYSCNNLRIFIAVKKWSANIFK